MPALRLCAVPGRGGPVAPTMRDFTSRLRVGSCKTDKRDRLEPILEQSYFGREGALLSGMTLAPLTAHARNPTTPAWRSAFGRSLHCDSRPPESE